MLKIYKASAGSGKTHTLTRDYLLMIFGEKSHFSNVLAVTFTNKAAGEMKDRIIAELYNLSQNPEKSPFFSEIAEKTNLSAVEIGRIAKENLTKILHNYSFFNISTIDSFVQKIIRSFAFELRIPASYGVELDVKKVADALTDELLSGVKDNAFLKKWLVNYAFDKISDGKKWDFRSDISDFAMQLFREDFYSVFDKLNSGENNLFDLTNELTADCYAFVNFYEKEIEKITLQAVKIIENSGIFEVANGAVKYLCQFFYSQKPYFFEPNKTLTKALNGGNWWTKKTPSAVVDQWTETVENLKNLLQEILDFQQAQGKKYFSAKLILKNIYNFGILNNLQSLLPDYRDKANVLLISDLNLLLRKITGDNEAPFIYEKIGNKFKNIMIDEFQDTSDFQWHNFRPLIENSLAEGYENLIVGDVKQSIYRWRNGDWRLLHSKIKRQLGDDYVIEKTLETNWRSKENIVKFNNALFSVLPEILQEKVNQELVDAEIDEDLLNLLPQAYSDVKQKVAEKNKNGGVVSIEFFNSRKWKDEAGERLLELLPELLEKFQPGEIGILVRTNAEASFVMNLLLDFNAELDKTEKFNVISEESLLLINSLAVRLIINALKLIDEPDDAFYLTTIIVDYLQLQGNDIPQTVFEISEKQEAEQFLPVDFLALLPKMNNYSLFELVEKIISIFGLNKISTELPFIRSFQEIVLDFSRHNGADLRDFLDFWNERNDSFSVQLSDVKDAVQIVTIHKSKGLAFGVVIIPFMDWTLSPKTGTIVWTKTEKSEFDKVPYLPLVISKEMARSEFAKDYAQETLYSYMDNLNVLYVALTRAKERIYAFSYATKNKKGGKIGDYIFRALNQSSYDNDTLNLKEFFDEQTMSFFIGDEDTGKKTEKKDQAQFNLTDYLANDWTDTVAIVAHGDEFISETLKNRRLAIKHGILMHTFFERLRTFDDVDDVIKQMKDERKISDKDIAKIKESVLKLFENNQIKNWFSGDWEVFAEREILTSYGEIKIPDRVMANENEVIVIDYKFGEKRSEHKRQVKKYAALLREIYPQKKVSAYLLYFETETVEKVE